MTALITFKLSLAQAARITKALKGRKPCPRCGAQWCVHYDPKEVG